MVLSLNFTIRESKADLVVSMSTSHAGGCGFDQKDLHKNGSRAHRLAAWRAAQYDCELSLMPSVFIETSLCARVLGLLPNQLSFSTSALMAKSRFEYVRNFETEDRCLPNCWIVVRIDGKGFHRFSDKHNFQKPNDERALRLMSNAAKVVMSEFKDIVLGYGQSDEYSFVFRKQTETYNRRSSKLMSNVVSLFSSSYVYSWKDFMPEQELKYPPAFDSRVVLYPSTQNLRDYLSWRQVDCHINNLYNTCFWNLVQVSGLSNHEAQERLKGTDSGEKNELLFSKFDINYNSLPQIFRKGTVLIKEKREETVEVEANDGVAKEMKQYKRTRSDIVDLHVDIIGKEFWQAHPDILAEKS